MDESQHKDYTRLDNNFIDILIKHRFPGSQIQILLFIIRRTIGWNKKYAYISNTQFTEATNICKNNVCRAVAALVKKNIVIKIDTNKTPKYCFNMNYDTWKN